MNQPPKVLSSFSQLRILSVGDLILDRYWWGEANRLSPEAPVPVLLKKRVSSLPGGAANTAANVAALGASVSVLGVVGGDDEGLELLRLLEQNAIGTSFVRSLPGRPTTTKTRLISGHQHLLRVDSEDVAPVSEDAIPGLIDSFRKGLEQNDAVLISDYAKGLLAPSFLATMLAEAARTGKPTFIDPKGMQVERYAGAKYLKPNRLELGILAGQSVRSHGETLAAGRLLRARLPGTSLLVTEAADGMTFFGENGDEFHVQSETREVFDITGAGDTVMAAFGLSIAAGAHPREAMEIASVAAAISISILGCATVTVDQIRNAWPTSGVASH